MTHWKAMTDAQYLGAYSLEDGADIVLTIKEVRKEPVVGSDGKKEDCAVCHWQENQKPMILNVTNLKMIAKVSGSDYIENWPGTKVRIGTEKVRAFGTVTDALRIRDEKVKDDAKPIACEQCGQVIQPCFGMTAAEWAKYSKTKMGKSLCADCANKLKEAEKNG